MEISIISHRVFTWIRRKFNQVYPSVVNDILCFLIQGDLEDAAARFRDSLRIRRAVYRSQGDHHEVERMKAPRLHTE